MRYNFKDLLPRAGRPMGGNRTARSGQRMRGKLVVGNWKMNGGLAANAALLSAIAAG
jgi:hypothetical protein